MYLLCMVVPVSCVDILCFMGGDSDDVYEFIVHVVSVSCVYIVV